MEKWDLWINKGSIKMIRDFGFVKFIKDADERVSKWDDDIR